MTCDRGDKTPFAIVRLLRRLKCSRAATAVEFALIFPIFLVMVLGIVEAGRAMWIQATMQYACEEATRYAMVYESLDDATIQTHAEEVFASVGLGVTGATFTPLGDTVSGITFMTVSGEYSFVPIVQIIGWSSFTLTASSRAPRST